MMKVSLVFVGLICYGTQMTTDHTNHVQKSMSQQSKQNRKKMILTGVGVVTLCVTCLTIWKLMNQDNTQDEQADSSSLIPHEYKEIVSKILPGLIGILQNTRGLKYKNLTWIQCTEDDVFMMFQKEHTIVSKWFKEIPVGTIPNFDPFAYNIVVSRKKLQAALDFDIYDGKDIHKIQNKKQGIEAVLKNYTRNRLYTPAGLDISEDDEKFNELFGALIEEVRQAKQ